MFSSEDKVVILIAMQDKIETRDISICYLDVAENYVEAEVYNDNGRRIIGVKLDGEQSPMAVGQMLGEGAIEWAERSHANSSEMHPA